MPRKSYSQFGYSNYTSEIITLNDMEQVALMGDLEKWVPMSEQRISNIINYRDFLLIELDGVVDEQVNFFFRDSFIIFFCKIVYRTPYRNSRSKKIEKKVCGEKGSLRKAN